MVYGLGESLADYGFSFLEKLHVPIFLVHKNGTIKKINEAGRKLLSVAHISARDLDGFAKAIISSSLCPQQVECQRYVTTRKQFKVISKQLGTSDYLLVELIR